MVEAPLYIYTYALLYINKLKSDKEAIFKMQTNSEWTEIEVLDSISVESALETINQTWIPTTLRMVELLVCLFVCVQHCKQHV